MVILVEKRRVELRQRKRNKRYTQLEQKEKGRMGVNYCGYCCDTHIAGIFKEEKPFVCTQQKKWIHIGALHKTGSMQTKKGGGAQQPRETMCWGAQSYCKIFSERQGKTGPHSFPLLLPHQVRSLMRLVVIVES